MNKKIIFSSILLTTSLFSAYQYKSIYKNTGFSNRVQYTVLTTENEGYSEKGDYKVTFRPGNTDFWDVTDNMMIFLPSDVKYWAFDFGRYSSKGSIGFYLSFDKEADDLNAVELDADVQENLKSGKTVEYLNKSAVKLGNRSLGKDSWLYLLFYENSKSFVNRSDDYVNPLTHLVNSGEYVFDKDIVDDFSNSYLTNNGVSSKCQAKSSLLELEKVTYNTASKNGQLATVDGKTFKINNYSTDQEYTIYIISDLSVLTFTKPAGSDKLTEKTHDIYRFNIKTLNSSVNDNVLTVNLEFEDIGLKNICTFVENKYSYTSSSVSNKTLYVGDPRNGITETTEPIYTPNPTTSPTTPTSSPTECTESSSSGSGLLPSSTTTTCSNTTNPTPTVSGECTEAMAAVGACGSPTSTTPTPTPTSTPSIENFYKNFSSLSNGWHLLGADREITTSEYQSAEALWIYENGEWVSKNDINSIKPKQGFWFKK